MKDAAIAGFRIGKRPHHLSVLAILLQFSMFQMNSRATGAVRDKRDFNLSVDGSVRLPVGADFLCQHQAARRLPNLYAPIAFGTVCTPLERPTTGRIIDRCSPLPDWDMGLMEVDAVMPAGRAAKPSARV